MLIWCLTCLSPVFNSLQFCILFCCLWIFFFEINFFQKKKKNFEEYHQSVKQFGSRSGPTFCRAWSGSKQFAKIVSRWQRLPLVGKELRGIDTLSGEATISELCLPHFWYHVYSKMPLVGKELRGIDTLSGEATISELCLPHFWYHVYSKMEEIAPFSDPVLEGGWCARKQAGSHKSCFKGKNIGRKSSRCILFS